MSSAGAFQKRKVFAANKNLTTYFQTHFPLPQGHSWSEFTLPLKWKQRVMLCLPGKRLKLGSVLRLPGIRKNTRRHSNAMPPHGTSTPSFKSVTSLTSSLSSKKLLHGSGKGVQIKVPTVAKIISHHHVHQPGWKILSLQNDGRQLHPPRQMSNRGAPVLQPSPYSTTFTPYQRAKILLS